MDDDTETGHRSRALPEAARMARCPRPEQPAPPEHPAGDRLDDLEWWAAALEVAVEHLEQRLAPVRLALSASPSPARVTAR
jgi:hypothetical protein